MFVAVVLYALLGMIIGSFLNVIVLRSHTGRSALSGRSGCLSCNAPLLPLDLIPVISYLRLRGRCRTCGSHVSLQYPLVELLCGILFALIGMSAPLSGYPAAFPAVVCSLTIVSVLLLIAVYDLRHTIIPDRWAILFSVLALLSQFLVPAYARADVFTIALSGPIVALPLFLIWLFSSGRAMGLGDVKLAFGIGWLLGPGAGLVAVMFAFILGSVVSVPLLILSKRSLLPLFVTPMRTFGLQRLSFTMKSEIAFGPFLISSCIMIWIAVLYGMNVLAPFGIA